MKKWLSSALSAAMIITFCITDNSVVSKAVSYGARNSYQWQSMPGYSGTVAATDEGVRLSGAGQMALFNYFYDTKFINLNGFHTTITIDEVTPFVGGGHQSYLSLQFAAEKNEAVAFNNAYPGLLIILAPNQSSNIYNAYTLMNNGNGLSASNFSSDSSFPVIPNGGAFQIKLLKDSGGNWHLLLNGTDAACDLSAIKSVLDSGAYFGIKAFENNTNVAAEQSATVTVRQINGEALGNHIALSESSFVKSTKGNTDAGSSVVATAEGLQLSAVIHASGYLGFKYGIGDPIVGLDGFSTTFHIDKMDGYSGVNGVSNNLNFALTTFNATGTSGLPAGGVNSDRLDAWDYFGAPVASARGIHIRLYRNSDTSCQTMIFLLGSNGTLDYPGDFLSGNNVTIGSDGKFNISLVKSGGEWKVLVNGENVVSSSISAVQLAELNAELDALSQYGSTPVYASGYDSLGNLSSASTVLTVESINNRPVGNNTVTAVTGVTLDKTELALTAGQAETLKATVLPEDADNQTVYWTSGNPRVAVVVGGNVTAVAPGTADITVTTQDGSFAATCQVTVTPVVSFDRFILSDHTVTGLTSGMTVEDLVAATAPKDGAAVVFRDFAGNILSGSDRIGTGSTLTAELYGIKNVYTFILFGDVNGDGLISSTDISTVTDYMLGKKALGTIFETAGDIYNEGEITLNSYVGIMEAVSSGGQINQQRGVEVYNVYDLDQYTEPFWQGDTVYNESVMVLANADGTINPIPLLYHADQILSIHDAQLSKEYVEGVDYSLENGKLVILSGSSIPVTAYSDYYLTEAVAGHSFACTKGGYLYFTEGATFHNKQIAVTYKHSDSWQGNIPSYQGSKLSATAQKLINKEHLNIVFYGDSVMQGTTTSGGWGVAPYMPTWTELLVEKLKDVYGYDDITFTNTAVGGTGSAWGVQNVQSRVNAYSPDLVVLGFGANDAQLGGEQYTENLRQIIAAVKAKNPNTEILLTPPLINNAEAVGFYGLQYLFEAAEAVLTEEFAGVAQAPVTTINQYLLNKKRFYDMTANNVNHPNDFLSRMIAQTAATALIES